MIGRRTDDNISNEKDISVRDSFHYYWEENRLKSFTNWPFSDKNQCNPKKMAQAGFYACGSKDETDLAKCFFCNKELDGWEPDDDPWLEHSKHSKNCIFLKYNGAEDDLTVEEHIELIRTYFENVLNNKVASVEAKIQKDFNETLATAKSVKKK
ncbi:hypothetical protein R5R35_007437 [Gryllus longicercus]|uniref:Uncharacterized protein n=1 Tax=Gryllus longicercus TaxID=2509291 RepID=A0AAN9YY65_9ORTH